MSNHISEAKGQQPVGDAAAVVQKKARQLVYDARYEVKGILGNKKVDPVSQERMILQRIAKSTSSPAVKAMARQMVSKKRAAVKEEFVADIQETATDNVVKALFKVFVEGVEAPQIENTYLEELAASGEKKYKIRVTDTKTGNSYVRYATREKISQLRSQGLKVELTEYGEPREGEKKRGEDTARAKKATKLDPVGKEDGDVDNDGDRDKSDKYLMKRRKAIGSAIEKRQTVSASYEPEGEALDEMMRRPKFQYGNKNKAQSSRSHPGRGGGSIQNPQARFNASSSPNPSTTSSDSSNRGDVKEAHKPGHKKHKKTTEPRWQDSDGDGKWYEPEDVKKEDYVWTEAKTKEEKTNGTAGVDNYTSGAIKLFPQEEDGVKTPSVRLSINSSFEAEGPILTEKSVSKAQQKFFGMVRATQKGEMEAPSPEVAAAAKSMKKKDVKDFASTEHKGLPEKKKGKKKRKKVVKEESCGTGDSRGSYTTRNLIKNKLRAMGAKDPMISLTPDDISPEEAVNMMTDDQIKSPTPADEKNFREKLRNKLKEAVGGPVKMQPGSGLGGGVPAYPAGQEPKPTGAKLPFEKAAKKEILKPLVAGYEPEGEMVDEGRDRYRSLGRADRNDGRNRYMGSPTPQQEAEENRRADEAAARAVAQLRRRREAEKARKEGR